MRTKQGMGGYISNQSVVLYHQLRAAGEDHDKAFSFAMAYKKGGEFTQNLVIVEPVPTPTAWQRFKRAIFG